MKKVLLFIFTLTPFATYAMEMESFADLAEKLTPAVVNISSSRTVKTPSLRGFEEFPKGSPLEGFNEFFKRFGNPRVRGQKSLSLGSGFLISADGYIVTNNHVIEGADEIKVTYGKDTEYDVEVIGADKKTDLALLKVKGKIDKPLAFVEFGDSDKSRIGDWVVVIGNPFGFGGSVTTGIISARARDIHSGPFDDFIQTDAAINRGSSGGPMFNLNGEVIGINTAIYSPSGGSVGIGFAVPSSLAKPIIEQLKTNGKVQRGWLGVRIQTITEEIAESLGISDVKGALVAEVMSGSPASKSELKAGDIILKFDDKEVSTMKKLPRIVAETVIGKNVNVEILRDGKRETIKVAVGELNEDEDKKSSKNQDDDEDAILGMVLKPITDAIREKYGLENNISGLIVEKVKSDSVAEVRNILKGDVILKINQTRVSTIKEFLDVMKHAEKQGRKSILILLNRSGDNVFVAIPLSEE